MTIMAIMVILIVTNTAVSKVSNTAKIDTVIVLVGVVPVG